MFAIERQKIINKLIKEHGQVEVTTLSQMLNVSEVTIRKDLEKLQKDLVLVRTHGGAILQDETIIEPTKTSNLEELAVVGTMLINDNDTIMLVNGEINRLIAPMLEQKNNITVITNDVEVAYEIKINSNSKVIVMGGDLNIYENALYGHFTINNVNNFYVDKCFAEIDGINENLNITCQNPDKAILIENCFNNANEKILMFNSAAYMKNSLYRASNINNINSVITSADVKEELKNKFFKVNIKLYTPMNILERGYKI
ncbi:MAG: DeoR/GlpR family DNA-binding transcription regulator [Lachnospirales bacterium]